MVARWAVQGVGKWMAHDRLDGALVRRGGFTRMDLNGEQVLELGWTVRDALTGRGYATEIGRAAIDWAAEHSNGLSIVAFTEIHNDASQGVMRHLGMQPAGVLYRNGLVQGREGMHANAPFALYQLPTTT
jgi:RimJ/RimL family protein N-acetyltransferase